MTSLPSDCIKMFTMHPLQERVVENGCCPRCHKKTLASKHIGGELEFFQCSQCLHVYVLPERRLTG